jgi:hypothetical protein
MKRGPWVKIFGDAWRHQKPNEVSAKAELAWYRMLSWCAESGTDGRFSATQFRIVNGSRCGDRTLRELVKTGLVDQEEGGYVMHQYLDHNIAHADWQRRQVAERDKKRRQRADVPGDVPGGQGQMSRGDSGGDTHGCPPGSPAGTVLNPDPASREGGYLGRDPAPLSEHWLLADGYSSDGELQ